MTQLKNSPIPDGKRPYAPPELQIYGDLAQITATAGNKGKTDHGIGAKNRTH